MNSGFSLHETKWTVRSNEVSYLWRVSVKRDWAVYNRFTIFPVELK